MWNKRQIAGIFLILGMLLFMACAPKATPVPAPQAPAAAPAPAKAAAALPVVPAKPAWQTEWDRVLAEARKEGRVLVYASEGTVRLPWSAAMERYGVTLEMIVGRAAEWSQKILTERRVGIYTADIYAGGSTTAPTLLKPKGALDPMVDTLLLPEVKDPRMWYGEKLPFSDKEQTIFGYLFIVAPAIPINTSLVKPGEIKSYNDLLNPKWLGKIATLDPSKGGSSGTFLCVVSEIMGWDYMRKLAENKPVIMANDYLMLEWLAHGKVAITLNAQSLTFSYFRTLGLPIGVVIPEEGTWLTAGSSTTSLFNRAPHPNAAKVFLNWLFGKEGQTVTSKVVGFQSRRADVPTDFLDPQFLFDRSKKYFLSDSEEFVLSMPEKFRIAKEVFKDVLK